MVWLRYGANDLEAFTDLRMRRSFPYGMDLTSDHFFSFEPSSPELTSKTPWVDAINPAVSDQIARLGSDTKDRSTIPGLLDLIEHEMLVISPLKRIRIQDLCTALQYL
jgi:hypothetical protein